MAIGRTVVIETKFIDNITGAAKQATKTIEDKILSINTPLMRDNITPQQEEICKEACQRAYNKILGGLSFQYSPPEDVSRFKKQALSLLSEYSMDVLGSAIKQLHRDFDFMPTIKQLGLALRDIKEYLIILENGKRPQLQPKVEPKPAVDEQEHIEEVKRILAKAALPDNNLPQGVIEEMRNILQRALLKQGRTE